MSFAMPLAMAYVITKICEGTCDTACVRVCPMDCIHGPLEMEVLAALPKEAKAEMQLYIDPDECIDCGACEPECPVEAIYLDEQLPEAHREDLKRNADFFRASKEH